MEFPARYLMSPSTKKELLVSPGCTLAVITTYFFRLYMGIETLLSLSSNSDNLIKLYSFGSELSRLVIVTNGMSIPLKLLHKTLSPK